MKRLLQYSAGFLQQELYCTCILIFFLFYFLGIFILLKYCRNISNEKEHPNKIKVVNAKKAINSRKHQAEF